LGSESGDAKFTTDPNAPTGSPDEATLNVASYLWQEYEYRHDMVWRLAFRVTAVAAALLIAPFLTDKEVQDRVGNMIIALPIFAVFVILGGIYVMGSELKHLKHIRSAYHRAQNDALCYLGPKDWTRNPLEISSRLPLLGRLHFGERVVWYLSVLFVLAVVYCVWFIWVWL
jgi:hypothetical protein